ncbi:J-domain-containing protein [Brachybacterium tyrofermentans]|uniref:J-domain-containing protein n=1 Tax=Brachybacterium tyrofermentans TaxID=47848 RepID=UPI003FB8F50C
MSSRDDARVQSELEQAIARGDFDDLPGAGKPLDLPASPDPDWWIRQRLAEDDVDRDALLPVVMLLRREYERRDDTLVELPNEQSVREFATEFTQRVHDDRRANPLARVMAPEMDPDDAVERWRELRAATADREPARAETAVEGRRPRRRWWPFGRRG